MANPEDLAKALGKPGKFQVLLIVLLGLNYTYTSWNHLGMTFLAAKTKHHCRVENATDIARLVPLVNKDGKKQWDQCHLYTGINDTKKVPCPNGWTYYFPERESTVVAKWDLVCNNAYKKSLATTIYFIGVMLGSVVFGALSDKFGRRRVLFFTMYSPCIIGLLLFFVQDYIAFVILRFVLGFLLQGLQIASYTTIVEVLAIQYRTTGGISVGLFWSMGVMSLPLISYLIQDWQYIQLFSILACLSQIGLICFLPESFRWLLIKKRIDEAERVVERIATFNKRPFPREVFLSVVEESEKSETDSSKATKNYTIVDIFRFSVLRKRSIILAWVWFSTSCAYYGLALNTSSLAGNKHLNFFISGIFEFIICSITIYFLNRFGRCKILSLYSAVGGITCIAAGILSSYSASDSLSKLTTSLALTGRVTLSGCFTILYFFTSELYPTEIRNVGLGAGLFWARVGSILAPQILLLAKYTSKSVPFIVFGSCILLASGLSLLLPETLNIELTETIEQASNFASTRKGPFNVYIDKDGGIQLMTDEVKPPENDLDSQL